MKALLAALAIFISMAPGAAAPPPAGDWDFTARAEIIRDTSGNENHLRIQGCDWVASKLGQALRIPASSGRVWREQPGEALRPKQALGMMAWIRLLGTGQYGAVVRHGKGWGEEGTVGYRLLAYGDGLRFMLKAGRIITISGGTLIRGQ